MPTVMGWLTRIRIFGVFNFLPLKSGSPTRLFGSMAAKRISMRFNFLPLKSGSPTTQRRVWQKEAGLTWEVSISCLLRAEVPHRSRKGSTMGQGLYDLVRFNFLPLKSGSPT